MEYGNWDRRRFLAFATALGGGWLANAAGCSAKSPPVVQQGAVTREGFDLLERTILDLQSRMKAGELSSLALVEHYAARIAGIDHQGPELCAMISVNPDAPKIAKERDAERKAGKVRGPLHGIPIVIKDNIDTADQMPTTAGSLALKSSFAKRDAFVMERLRASGAVLLGKTNLSEWANFRSTRATSGWSALGGQCKNPYMLDRNPCGSSSGTGAAVSANYAVAGIGTETDGSIVCPSSHCGLVGLKPTVGLVSRSGIVPISHSQDTAGPMARTVTDVAILLGAMVGEDSKDEATANSKGKTEADYTLFLDKNGLRGATLGVWHGKEGHPDVTKLFTKALDVMRELGANLIDPVELPWVREVEDPEFEVLLYEFKSDLMLYLQGLDDKVGIRSLKDLIAFNEQHAAREMRYFGQELFLQAEAKGTLQEEGYRKALEQCQRLSRTEGLDALMARHGLNAVVAPTGGPAWITDLVNGDHFTGGSSTPSAVSGYPSITLPMGFVAGLPVGISFFSAAWREPELLKLAYGYEQATHHRKPPQFLPKLER